MSAFTSSAVRALAWPNSAGARRPPGQFGVCHAFVGVCYIRLRVRQVFVESLLRVERHAAEILQRFGAKALILACVQSVGERLKPRLIHVSTLVSFQLLLERLHGVGDSVSNDRLEVRLSVCALSFLWHGVSIWLHLIGARLGLLFHKVKFAPEILFKRTCAVGYFLIHIRAKVSYKSVHPVPGQALHRGLRLILGLRL